MEIIVQSAEQRLDPRGGSVGGELRRGLERADEGGRALEGVAVVTEAMQRERVLVSTEHELGRRRRRRAGRRHRRRRRRRRLPLGRRRTPRHALFGNGAARRASEPPLQRRRRAPRELVQHGRPSGGGGAAALATAASAADGGGGAGSRMRSGRRQQLSRGAMGSTASHAARSSAVPSLPPPLRSPRDGDGGRGFGVESGQPLRRLEAAFVVGEGGVEEDVVGAEGASEGRELLR